MSLTAENWPITAALLQAPNFTKDGVPIQDADASEWQAVFEEVADAGFANVDLTDSWVRPPDLTPGRLDELKQAAAAAGVGAPVITAIRPGILAPWRSPAQPGQGGETSLDYLAILAPKRGDRRSAGYSAAIRGGSCSSSGAA